MMTLERLERFRLGYSKRILPEWKRLQKRLEKGEKPIMVQLGGVSGETALLPSLPYVKRQIARRERMVEMLTKKLKRVM